MMSVGRRVEFEFRVRSCALYAKQQSLPFQFADLEDLPYVGSRWASEYYIVYDNRAQAPITGSNCGLLFKALGPESSRTPPVRSV